MARKAGSLEALFEQLSRGIANILPIELPWGKDIKKGKEVSLKYHVTGPIWKTIAKGKWKEYSKQKQVVAGGFDCTLEVIDGDKIKYSLKAESGERVFQKSGTVKVTRRIKCDDCDKGKRNNQAHLNGTNAKGRFETWPKNSDRTRIIFEKKDGKQYQVELDTKE